MEEHFGESNHNSISLKIVLNRDKTGPCGKVLKCNKARAREGTLGAIVVGYIYICYVRVI